ncbi:MAG: alpha-2-macroglobulin family protein [Opitutaceae bacterium]|nr:alpha-2-macroglobulin family protein [Opitutaceae bacterium]
MNRPLVWWVLALAVLAPDSRAGPRDAEWREVESATQQGRPQTAIERLEPIITAALAEKSYAEAVKGIGRKIALQGTIQGNKPEERIVRLQAELAQAPAAMKPMLEGILAHWYWHYFQQNRWRFMQRTQTATAPGPDLQTWDLARILAEIDRHFVAALADEATLKASPIRDWDNLLPIGTVPDNYRPTLFDFLAYEALQFYQTGEHASVTAEDEFEVEATGPIFAAPADFARWTPQTTDRASPKLKAIALYQTLLKFHQSDTHLAAYYDADLARLTYGRNVARGEDKDDRFKAALRRFVEATAKHEISARALATLATQLNAEKDPMQARELAQRGFDAFPETAGGALCFNVIEQIEAKSAQLDTEYVWNAPWPTLNVTYRNITKVYFRAMAVDFTAHLEESRWGDSIDQERLEKLLATPPTLEWSADLPPTTDFKPRTENLPSPTKLKPGFYLIVASHEPAFGVKEDQVSVATVWVSDLALVSRMRTDGGKHSGFVLQANSGDPVAGALVRFWQRDNQSRFSSLPSTETDQDGQFQFVTTDSRPFALLAEYRGHAVSSHREIYAYGGGGNRDHADSQAVFFTDRAIYRPGQTINYKGVFLRHDRNAGNYSVIAGLSLIVVFNDVNGLEIARATHRTNDYGSFSGVFTAPRDRVMGRMRLQVLNRSSQTSIRVEEYKRPKFRVEIDPPVVAAKLGEPVTVAGHATAYTGAAIGGAKVKWRVERAVQLPYWCWWWWGQPPATKAIAHGTAVTQPDGTFQIQFPAEPDRAVPAKDEPIFAFTVHADVTDTTGETRSENRIVRAGYTALQASLTAAEWQTPDQPVEFTLGTESLDGEPHAASGTVTVHTLRQPPAVERAALRSDPYRWRTSSTEPKPDPANPDSWELGAEITRLPFKTDATGVTKLTAPLKAGIYRASLETTDRFGKKITARQTIEVNAPRDARYTVKRANRFIAPKWSLEPGESFSAVWGTGYDFGRAFVELECAGQPLQSYWTSARRTQERIELPVTPEMRGGFTVRVTYVRENRAYLNERIVTVPWSNKQLTVKWESFRSKLVPGQRETWTATVSGPDAKGRVAEMVAALYDASLDQYAPHSWPQAFPVFRWEFGRISAELQNSVRPFRIVDGWDGPAGREPNWRYRAYPPEIIASLWGWGFGGLGRTLGAVGGAVMNDGEVRLDAFVVSAERTGNAMAIMASAPMAMAAMAPGPAPVAPAPAKPDLTQITARKNLSETAFFIPHLLAKKDGTVHLTFTMPEALTEWKFLGFAHDKELRAGFLTDKAVTAKDLMVEPNPPRFVREGDELEFTVKVSNRTDRPQTGTVKLTFADAATVASVDVALGHRAPEQTFELPAKQSRSFSWRIAVPDGLGFLTYKAVAATASSSDGEEGFLPVLSRRILVAESLPLPIRGQSTKEFAFAKLLGSGSSNTLRHQLLTVQMTSQPAWYAVMALPYLMEYPYECSEQVFNRLYANALARHIASSDPKIRRIFDLWKNTPALDSPLEKNQDLKSVMIEETPWLRQAKAEGEARRNVGLLFEANRLDEETARGLRTLAERQRGDGLWPWFPGGPSSEYISLYIMTGFGRLRHLGVTLDAKPAVKSLTALDAWMTERHRKILQGSNPMDYVPSYLDALYLYGRSFFLADQPVAETHRAAVDFFLGQSRKFWVKLDSCQSQAHLALALQRFGDADVPRAIMTSLKERSVTDAELGRFWRDTELSWWWYRAPIETQALMIEAFAEVTNDTGAVEDCKVWLLKQKQTQDWKTTKATADAIYGLLLRGSKLLSSDSLVEVALAGQTIKPEKVEAGTGFYQTKFGATTIKPAMGQITVKKHDDGVSWGSIHWQYLEDVAKITPHEGTPLKLKKFLFIKETTGKGPVLKAVTGPVAVGDELVVRLELRTDRDMEYVHLKDQRGSGTEPVNVLSRYRHQDGLAYYESTRDTASHFFIDYLPKGVYVFEYSTRVQLKGRYQTGLAEIQCMYAPEFNSHSENIPVEVR